MASWTEQLSRAAKVVIAKAEAAAKEVVTDGAAIIRDQAKEIVPVQSGDLQKSIFSTLASESGGKVEAIAGTNIDYADDVEFGKYENPEVQAPPQPFLRTAAAVSESMIRKRAESVMKQAFK